MKEFKTDNYLVTIKESDEKEPLGIIIDVWDKNENLIDTFSFLNEDVEEEEWVFLSSWCGYVELE